MYAKMICYPPLGQPTVIPAGQETVDFIVLLETAAESSTRWQVALWHSSNADDEDWTALDFSESSGKHELVSLSLSFARLV
jgi:hypothetical protein